MEQNGTTCEIKVAVLEQRVIDLKEIVLKLEETIEKVNELNLNVIKMLAVHEERITFNEQSNQTAYKKVLELEYNANKQKEELDKKINDVKKDYEDKYNSLVTKIALMSGGLGVAVFIIANFNFFDRLINSPSTDKSHLTNSGIYARLV